MEIKQHKQRKGGAIYWTYHPVNDQERALCMKHGLKQSNFDKTGGTYYGGDASTKIKIETESQWGPGHHLEPAKETKMIVTEHRYRGHVEDQKGRQYWVVSGVTGMDAAHAADCRLARLNSLEWFTFHGPALDKFTSRVGEHKFSDVRTDTSNDPLGKAEGGEQMQEQQKPGMERMDYEAMSVADLRTAVAAKCDSMGLKNKAAMRALPKAKQVEFLLTGEVPQAAGGVADPATAAQKMMELLGTLVPQQTVDEETIRAIIREEMGTAKQVFQIILPDMQQIEAGVQHKDFPKLCSLVSIRQHTMLVGPAGSGKTHAINAAAQTMTLKFYSISVGMQTTKTDLLGYMDANGNYIRTQLRDAVEFGGVFLLDEADAGNANVLTVLNAILANGWAAFPDKMIEVHKDFVCFCAMNTFGRGADRQYVGRNQLDAASLDRFVVVDFDYDENLERLLTGNDDWASHVQKYRRAAQRTKERIVISPRASYSGAKLLAAGFSWKDAEEMAIWKGIADDIRTKIKAAA